MIDTIDLCRRLGELLWPGYENPEATKDDMDGYAWLLYRRGTILEEWIPNPGRRALLKEVEKLLGTEEFEKQILKGAERSSAHKIFSHEDWMRAWIKLKEKKLNNI